MIGVLQRDAFIIRNLLVVDVGAMKDDILRRGQRLYLIHHLAQWDAFPVDSREGQLCAERAPLFDRPNKASAVASQDIPQELGADYEIADGRLLFQRALKKDKVSGWRWALGAFGVGTYRQDDSVDIRWTRPNGMPAVSERLDVELVAD